MSTETSQLERISRHLAPRSSKRFVLKNDIQKAPNEEGLYFHPHNGTRDKQEPLKSRPSFNLVIPESTRPKKIFQIDSRKDQFNPSGQENRTPTSNHEVLEIAQLHDRFTRQERQSSEEDMIAMETFVGMLV